MASNRSKRTRGCDNDPDNLESSNKMRKHEESAAGNVMDKSLGTRVASRRRRATTSTTSSCRYSRDKVDGMTVRHSECHEITDNASLDEVDSKLNLTREISETTEHDTASTTSSCRYSRDKVDGMTVRHSECHEITDNASLDKVDSCEISETKEHDTTSTTSSCRYSRDKVDGMTVRHSECHEITDNASPDEVDSKLNLTCKTSETTEHKQDETHELFVSHEYQDSELGDRFGATLDTFKERDYNRHILTNILPDSPAEKMKIENNDEIVVLNDVFAPQLSHTDVMNLFQHLPVDGKTKFDLIIRREKNKKWQWYDSSAILAPDAPTETYPNVGNASFAPVPKNKKKYPDHKKYKIPKTNFWLELHKSGPKVSADMSGNEKTVVKTRTISQDRHTGDYTFNCTLYGCACNMYLTIDSQRKYVKMQEIKPKKFQFLCRGTGTGFLLDDLYLACSNDNHITVSKSEYMFDEHSAYTGLDHPDHLGHDLPDNAGQLAKPPSLGQPEIASHHVHEPGVEHPEVEDTMVKCPDVEHPDVAGTMVKDPGVDQSTHALVTEVASTDSFDNGYRSGYVTPERHQPMSEGGNRKHLTRSNTAGLSNLLESFRI